MAGGAAAVPVIIHLLNRKRYVVVNWAAMRFLLAAQKKNVRRLKLEQWLLLAVRTLLVLLSFWRWPRSCRGSSRSGSGSSPATPWPPRPRGGRTGSS